MKNIIKKTLTMALLISMTCGIVGVSVPKQASAKTVSKVTKVITLTKKKDAVIHKLSIDKKSGVVAKIKFIEVKGKTTATGGNLYLGAYKFRDGTGTTGGAFFSEYSQPGKLTKKSFKKGKWLASMRNPILGKAKIEWNLPKGMKKLKIQITYYTKSGRKGIKSVK